MSGLISFIHTQEADSRNRNGAWLSTLKVHPNDILPVVGLLPKVSQSSQQPTAPPTGDQVFIYMSLGDQEHFIQNTTGSIWILHCPLTGPIQEDTFYFESNMQRLGLGTLCEFICSREKIKCNLLCWQK